MNELNLHLANTQDILLHTQRNGTTGNWINPALQLTSGPRRDRLTSSLAGPFSVLIDVTNAKSANANIHTVYITGTNQLNYMTVSATTNRILSAPVDLCTVFQELADWQTTNITMKRVSCVFIGIDLHLIVLMSDNTIRHYINTNGNWRRGPIHPESLTLNDWDIVINDIDCFVLADPANSFLCIAFLNDNLLTRANFILPNGATSDFSTTPSFSAVDYQTQGSIAKVDFVSVATYNNEIHYVISATPNSGNPAQLLHFKNIGASNVPSSETNLNALYTIPFGFNDVSCMFINSELHIVALSNEQNTNNNVKHTIRAGNGSWQSFLGNVNSVVSNIGYGKSVSVC